MGQTNVYPYLASCILSLLSPFYINTELGIVSVLDMSNRPTTKETQIAQWVIRGIGLMATVAATLYVAHLARKALDESVVTEETSHANTRNC
jgi:hypothetical protein